MIKKAQHTVRYFRYLLKARHSKGFGVHSPYSFDLITNVFKEKNQYYNYLKIEKIRKELESDKRVIDVLDYGTGKSGKRKIATIAFRSLKKRKYAQLLFRLVNLSKSVYIIELGTSLGITTAYIASANSKSKVYSFEGCPQLAKIAAEVLDKSDVRNTTIFVGNIDDTLAPVLEGIPSVDFVFFDANHTKEATLNYFNLCLNKISDQSVFVFDDIHHSKEMEEAWGEIKSNNKVIVSYDLFSIGVVLFKPELTKQDYILFI